MRVTVQAGETLGAIAQRFGTTVGELQRLNDILDADRVSAGHRLKVPERGADRPAQEAASNGGAGAAELFTVDQLAEISRNPDPDAFDLAGDRAALIPEMKKGGIVTKNQIAAFLANVCQETDWLKTLEEYGTEHYFRYGAPGGDGVYLLDEWRYHGRGYIMLTWSDNYRAAGKAIGVGDRLVNEPDLLANDKELAARTAVWYWTSRDCGRYADQGNFEAVCSLINRGEIVPKGPINHWAQRLEAYQGAKSVIGTGTTPLTGTPTEVAGTENGKAERWPWPVAAVPPRASGSYQDRHPTRYTWRPDVEEWARHLVDTYDCWVNTYVDHPEGFGRTPDSFDVWGPKGRNDPLDGTLGDTICDLLFNAEGKPDIDWIIYKKKWWTRASGVWRPFGENPFTWHDDHIHVTYLDA